MIEKIAQWDRRGNAVPLGFIFILFIPESHYHGISITIDLNQAVVTMEQVEHVLVGLHIDLRQIKKRLCRKDTCYVLRGPGSLAAVKRPLAGN